MGVKLQKKKRLFYSLLKMKIIIKRIKTKFQRLKNKNEEM